MRSIGIRAAPQSVTFAVYDSEEEKLINVEDLRVPRAFYVPDALKYIRSNLLDILREYSIESAGIRVTEPSAQSFNISRIQIEGVVLEAFASSALKSYYIGQISSISKRVGIERADFKAFIDGSRSWPIEGWPDLKKEQREAVLCAIGACVNA
jgi:hypothetical protein